MRILNLLEPDPPEAITLGTGTRTCFRSLKSLQILRRAKMAGGWTRDGAVQDQIDDSVKDAIAHARSLMPSGPGTKECDECGEPIPAARRRALSGVRTCVACQAARDAKVAHSAINRRGSKDSQLR
jgi:phage/conjugal plasmid C-4 type zinc finger TraR family protein